MYMGVSKYSGTPKWMVYNGKPYYKMDDLGGTKIYGNTHMRRKHLSNLCFITTTQNHRHCSFGVLTQCHGVSNV